ncbi:TonB-dependent receptor [Tunicatimonas pelagia]|uniref:TonB-dependent receptor n=1 Tax=Tunicatimonas pelagia TaxID=931531 RepID=UPI0026658946|nr:TonB-dependent receptor [Tunicatimonas pelagia]WKN42033.1 TonB-dependent receptor [Tunicatimonas pelagia]
MRTLVLLLFFLTTLSNVIAQTGTIRVSVFDNETGEALIGATVVIAGTTQGSVTDLDGKAAIGNLEPGSYNVQVSYVSYQPKTIEGVEVSADEVNAFEVQLASETAELEEVVVTAEIIRSSESALLTLQKKSPAVMDAISADMFSRNGDSDAAAAVRRVTGVTVEGGKYVYVRGLGDRYSKSILNGADIPGLDPNRNSVQLDLFPSNMIDNIIVYKTFTPDLTGEFAGGLVNVTTKDFPDRFTMQVSGSMGINDQATFNSDYLTYEGGGTDWLGFDDGTRELPGLLSQYTIDNFPSPATPGVSQGDVTEASQAFETNQFTPTRSAPPVNHSFSFSLGNQKEFLNRPLGFVVGLTYSRDYNFYGDGQVNRYDEVPSTATSLERSLLFTTNDAASTDDVSMGGLLNLSYKLSTNSKISFNIMRNQASTNVARFQDGFSLLERPDSTILLRNRVLSWTERGLTNMLLKGEHNIAELNNLNIEWQSSYTDTYMDEPDLRFLQSSVQIDGNDSINVVSNVNRPGRYFRDMTETNWDSRLNITLPINIWEDREAKVKFGGAYTQRERSFRERRFEYFIRRRTFSGDVDNLFLDQNLGYNSEGQQLNTLDEVSQDGNNYDAEQLVYAGYLMFDAPVTEKLRLVGGVRLEQTDMSLEAFDGVTGDLETTDLLPALNFTYELRENMNLRGSYGRTIARPTFREFAPLVTFAFYGDFNQIGNSELDRTLIDNYDIRWEMYPNRNEYVAASVFYKRFDNPIENTINPDAGGTTAEYKYENVDEGLIAGLEMEVRKGLGFISPFFEPFRVGVNATYIYSQVSLEADELSAARFFDPDIEDTRDMYGQSPYVVNANLDYNNFETGWSGNIVFNVFGERLQYFTTALPFVYEQPRPELNLSIKKQLNDRWSVRARANNLLNPAYEETITYRDVEYVFDSYTVGRDYSLSFTYLIE